MASVVAVFAGERDNSGGRRDTVIYVFDPSVNKFHKDFTRNLNIH